MNKKEVAELRKRFQSDRCSIGAMCGCYVNGEKEKIMQFRETFLMLEEEERHKFFEIFKKAMSGTFGRNLFNLDFPLEAEEAGGTQNLLMQLRACELKDDDVLEQFYQTVISNFAYEGNYLILLIYDAYDVLKKTSDGMTLEDASEEVYRYLLCCICPVNLTKPALYYDMEHQKFHKRPQDWVLESPEISFLFPAFNDRATDIHSTLYYTKNSEQLHDEFVASVLDGVTPVPANSQKEVFQAIITKTLGEDCEYEDIMNIQDTLQERVEEAKDIPEPLTLTRREMKDLLTNSGIASDKIENFDTVYDALLPEETPLVATNLMDLKKIEVKTPSVIIRVKPESAHLVKTRVIDGKNCIVIPMDEEVSVNGIMVTAGIPQESSQKTED